MKFEYLKEYKTRGGWKAVYMGELDRVYVFTHYERNKSILTRSHNITGKNLFKERSADIIGEWSEPKTGVVYVYFGKTGSVWFGDNPMSVSNGAPIASVRWTEGEFIEE